MEQDPFRSYKHNVQVLCTQLGIANPVQEEDLRVQSIVFYDVFGDPVMFTVQASEMNRAGRLFVQHISGGRTSVNIDPIIKSNVRSFFTPALCNDCGVTRRPLVFGMLTAQRIVITYK